MKPKWSKAGLVANCIFKCHASIAYLAGLLGDFWDCRIDTAWCLIKQITRANGGGSPDQWLLICLDQAIAEHVRNDPNNEPLSEHQLAALWDYSQALAEYYEQVVTPRVAELYGQEHCFVVLTARQAAIRHQAVNRILNSLWILAKRGAQVDQVSAALLWHKIHRYLALETKLRCPDSINLEVYLQKTEPLVEIGGEVDILQVITGEADWSEVRGYLPIHNIWPKGGA